MNRGDVVRPLPEVVERTKFRRDSRLRIAERRSEWPIDCKGCGKKLLTGELFARGKEHLSALCLECVEPLENGHQANFGSIEGARARSAA